MNPGYANSNPGNFVVQGAKLFFTADDGSHGNELWVSDGTAAGTHMVVDLDPGRESSVGSESAAHFFARDTPQLVAAPFGGSVVFQGYDGTAQHLFISDGTAAGTTAIAGSDSGYAVSGSKLFYTSTPGNNGQDLWVTDGTAGGAHLIEQIPGANGNVNLGQDIAMGGSLYFVANDGTHGNELWKSDGTPAGTGLLKDINPTGSASPDKFAVLGSELFFAADAGGRPRRAALDERRQHREHGCSDHAPGDQWVSSLTVSAASCSWPQRRAFLRSCLPSAAAA
ncbi:MAG: ELWxxDGT repeat protein [Rhizomicrobium sp.]